MLPAPNDPSIQPDKNSRSHRKTSFQPGLDAIIGIDTQGRIVFVNKTAEKLFQYTRAQLLGNFAETLIPVRNRSEYPERRNKSAFDPWWAFRGIAFTGRRRDGVEFEAAAFAEVVEAPNGPVMLSVIRHLKAEETLDEGLDQTKKMAALGRVASSVAHDFNNLLMVILTNAESALRDPGLKRMTRRSLEELQGGATEAASIAQQLLVFSRREVPSPKVIRPSQIVRDMASMLRRLLGSGIEIMISEGPDVGSIQADTTHVKQLLLNLAANARDAMEKGGRLTIEVSNFKAEDTAGTIPSGPQAGEYVLLKVSDTGPGLDANAKSHLFEPFFTTKEKGTGLGLATVHDIVKQCGGYIVVSSKRMRGTTFNIYLPRIEKAEEASPIPETSPSSLSDGETVLVVEDTVAIRKIVCRFLRGLGYNVVEARDSVTALRKIERYHSSIKLLLADVVMPIANGPELAMRLSQRNTNTRILFMTGHSENTLREARVPEGIPVLKKPFSMDELARAIRDLLGQHVPSQPS